MRECFSRFRVFAFFMQSQTFRSNHQQSKANLTIRSIPYIDAFARMRCWWGAVDYDERV